MNKICPRCGSTKNQIDSGRTKAGSQRGKCKDCGKWYTLNPKTKAYSEDVRQNAIKLYFSGVSGRGVGSALNMSKANVYNWIKKNRISVDKSGN